MPMHAVLKVCGVQGSKAETELETSLSRPRNNCTHQLEENLRLPASQLLNLAADHMAGCLEVPILDPKKDDDDIIEIGFHYWHSKFTYIGTVGSQLLASFRLDFVSFDICQNDTTLET